jgi:hypothetical protein
MITTIEAEANVLLNDQVFAEPRAPWSQIGEDPPIPDSLSHLLRGPLSTIPIDDVIPFVGVASDYRFNPVTAIVPERRFFQGDNLIIIPEHTIVTGYTYGVPEKGLAGESPNQHVPLATSQLPRGIAIQPPFSGEVPVLANTALNQVPTGVAPANKPLAVEAGQDSRVEVHSGAFQTQHDLVTYKSQQRTRGLTLHYDSVRALPQPIFYFNIANLDSLDPDAEYSFVAKLKATLPGLLSDTEIQAMGISAEQAVELGLSEGDLVFQIPKLPDPKRTYGLGLQMDFGGCESGVYNFNLEHGIFRKDE